MFDLRVGMLRLGAHVLYRPDGILRIMDRIQSEIVVGWIIASTQ